MWIIDNISYESSVEAINNIFNFFHLNCIKNNNIFQNFFGIIIAIDVTFESNMKHNSPINTPNIHYFEVITEKVLINFSNKYYWKWNLRLRLYSQLFWCLKSLNVIIFNVILLKNLNINKFYLLSPRSIWRSIWRIFPWTSRGRLRGRSS